MTTGERVTPDPTAAEPRQPDKPGKGRQPRPVDAASHEGWDPVASDDWTEDELLSEPAVSPGAGDDVVEAAPVVPEPSTWLPLVEGRSPRGTICPFLRAMGPDDVVGFPIETPDPMNRCAALTDVVPQSLRQQELVCLTGNHVNCPRYLRGAIEVSSVPATRPRIAGKPALTPAIAASLGILALSFAASVVFGLANGGLVLPSTAFRTPTPGTSASVIAIASPSASTSTAGASSAPATPLPSPSPTPLPSSPTSAPTPTEAPTTAPTPRPTPNPTPRSNRFALLKKCPDKPNCWIYSIHSGDNLFSIANYFGVSLDTVKALNPWTKTQRLKAGRQLIIPTPTR